MTLYRYIVYCRHDKGSVRILTHASGATAARQMVMAAERCPERSITEVRAVDEQGYELQAEHPNHYLVLEPTAVLIDDCYPPNPYRSGKGVKISTRYWVRAGTRWRRVYLDNRTDGVLYVERDSIRTIIILPKEEA